MVVPSQWSRGTWKADPESPVTRQKTGPLTGNCWPEVRERDKKHLSEMTPQQYLFNLRLHFLSTRVIISLRNLFVFPWDTMAPKFKLKWKKSFPFFSPLRFTFLIFFYSSLFCLFCSVRSVVWPVKLLTETTVNALKATELPGRFVLLGNTHVYAARTHTQSHVTMPAHSQKLPYFNLSILCNVPKQSTSYCDFKVIILPL